MLVEYTKDYNCKVYLSGKGVLLKKGVFNVPDTNLAKALVAHGYVTAYGTDDTPIDESFSQELRSFISSKGKRSGLASLDELGKLKQDQIPDSILGGVKYKGLWDGSLNQPELPQAASSNVGWYFKVSVAGNALIDNTSEWGVGDWVISDGVNWGRVDTQESIVSVNGQTGAVEITKLDLGLDKLSNNPQVIAIDSSIDGYIPQWSGSTGDKLKLGLPIGVIPNALIKLDSEGKLPSVDGSNLKDVNRGVSNLLDTQVFS